LISDRPRGRSQEEKMDNRLLLYSVLRENGCLEWTRPCKLGRQPQIWVNNTSMLVTRYAWEQYHNKKIPTGMFVCHTCDNMLCLHIDHLFLGTPKDNMIDMMIKGRAKPGGKATKLTTDIVKEIRILIKLGETDRIIATKFSMPVSTINKIRHNKTAYYMRE